MCNPTPYRCRSPLPLAAAVLSLLLLVPALHAAEAPALMDDFTAAYGLATRLYREGDYGGALKAYEIALSFEDVAEVRYGIARCHHQLGQLAEAVASYELFLRASPDHEGVARARTYLVQALFSLGRQQLEHGDAAGARGSLERGVLWHRTVSPAMTDATAGLLHAWLGDAHARLRNEADARAAYGVALKAVLPDAVRVRVEAGLAALDTGRPPPPLSDGPVPTPTTDGARLAKPGNRPVGPVLLGVAGGLVAVAGISLLPIHGRGACAPGAPEKITFPGVPAADAEQCARIYSTLRFGVPALAVGVTAVAAAVVWGVLQRRKRKDPSLGSMPRLDIALSHRGAGVWATWRW